jgi:hypothetical protein
MQPLIQIAINLILKWAYSLKKSDFETAVKWVMEAEKRFIESADKRAYVKRVLADALPGITGRASNFLIEMAVAKLGTLQAK